jgi:pimeloyl-ACP methyl ester carboxylesterase
MEVIVVLIVVTSAAWVVELLVERADRKRYPPPGELIDVGGYRMHLLAVGERRPGRPTIVFESGDGSWATHRGNVQTEVARFARVCAYGRAGFGWSDPSPKACTLGSPTSRERSTSGCCCRSSPTLSLRPTTAPRWRIPGSVSRTAGGCTPGVGCRHSAPEWHSARTTSRRRCLRWLVVVGAAAGIGYGIASLLRRKRCETPYRGNDGKRVFHGPDCRFFRSASTTAEFASRADAIDAGYLPCKVCNP